MRHLITTPASRAASQHGVGRGRRASSSQERAAGALRRRSGGRPATHREGSSVRGKREGERQWWKKAATAAGRCEGGEAGAVSHISVAARGRGQQQRRWKSLEAHLRQPARRPASKQAGGHHAPGRIHGRRAPRATAPCERMFRPLAGYRRRPVWSLGLAGRAGGRRPEISDVSRIRGRALGKPPPVPPAAGS